MDELEKYLKEQQELGYIDKDGRPLKCWCGSTDFKEDNQYFGEFGREEYQVKCKSCGKTLGHWAFGNWQI